MKIIKSRGSPVIHGKRLAGLWPILLLLAPLAVGVFLLLICNLWP